MKLTKLICVCKIWRHMFFFCLFRVFRPTGVFFTHIFWPLFGTRGHWAARVLLSLLWHRPTLYNFHFRGPVTLTSVAERLAVELLLPTFTTCISRWRSTPISRIQRKSSTSTPPRRSVMIESDFYYKRHRRKILKSVKYYFRFNLYLLRKSYSLLQ